MIVTLLSLGAVLALTLGTAVFVATEFALVSADRTRLEARAREGDRASSSALAAVRSLPFQLAGTQLGITLTTLVVGFLASPAIASLLRPVFRGIGLPHAVANAVAVVLALLLATVLEMVLGELVPKNLALARPLGVVRAVAGPMRLFTTIFRPLIAACNAAANTVLRRLGIEPQEELRSARTAVELDSLVRSSADSGNLPGNTARLLSRSLTFADRAAGDVMTPRTQVVALPDTATVAQMLDTARLSGHSRFPVVGTAAEIGADGDASATLPAGDIDNVRGVVHVKHAFAVPRNQRTRTRVAEIARPIPAVPDSLPLDPLLATLRRPGLQMAAVVDEYGGTAGVVTLEDLVEELVGEVQDEYDVPERPPTRPQTSEGSVLPGLTRIDELPAETGFRPPDGPFATIAGLILQRLGRLPAVGDTVEVEGFRLTVLELDGRRVAWVLLEGPPEQGDAPAVDSEELS